MDDSEQHTQHRPTPNNVLEYHSSQPRVDHTSEGHTRMGFGVFVRLHLHLRHFADATYNKSIGQKKEKHQYICQYSKDVHRTKCQALTITETARIRRYKC